MPTGPVQDTTLVELCDYRLLVDPRDKFIGESLIRGHIWEPLTTAIAEHEIMPGNVVLDLGANIGYFTLLFSRLVGPEGHVIAFEPEPSNFALLAKNVELNACRNVSLVQAGVSSATHRVPLYMDAENLGGHSLFEQRQRPAIDVECVTLDEYFECQPDVLGRGGVIDFVKMDIEGGEGHALRGMQQLLRRSPNVTILTEFWPGGLRESGVDARACLALLDDQGFNLYVVDERHGVRLFDRERLLATHADDHPAYWMLYCTRNEWHPSYDLPTMYARAERAIDAIVGVVPDGATFILLDEDKWATEEVIRGRPRLPFPERDGRYWGHPASDEDARQELARLRNTGVAFVAVAWTAFWWLDFYSEFAKELAGDGGRIHQDDDVVIFDLRK